MVISAVPLQCDPGLPNIEHARVLHNWLVRGPIMKNGGNTGAVDTDPQFCEVTPVWVPYAFVFDGSELVETVLELASRLVQGAAPAKFRAEANGGEEERGGRHPVEDVEPERGSTLTD